MNFETLQQMWHRQSVPAVPDQVALLKKVKNEAAAFDRRILRRDQRETVVAFFVAFIFAAGIPRHGWPYGIVSLQAFAIAVFFLIDRRRQRRWADTFDGSLLGQLDCAIQRTAHQVWLLENVFWWYVLPFLVGMGTVHLHKYSSFPWPDLLLKAAPQLLFDWLLAAGVYWLNQSAVRNRLQPRLTELRALRDQLHSIGRN